MSDVALWGVIVGVAFVVVMGTQDDLPLCRQLARGFL
jgi:hypothetical protein